MEKNQVSLTALMTAFERGYHAENDTPKVFNDFLAYSLLSHEERALFIHQFTEIVKNRFPDRMFASKEDALAFFIQEITSTADIISRARYTEDMLEEALKTRGVKQYVILGAGLDTFAFRKPELANQLHVFEVDHPATQTSKLQRIAELGWDKPANLHFVPVDFTKENIQTALTRSSYSPNTTTFLSWLGVTYYLPRDTVLSTLRSIANIAPAGSSIVFDYYDTNAFIPGKASPRMQGWKYYTQQAGEPIITGFDPSALEQDIAALGLRLQENLNPSEIEKRYFTGRTDNYHATEHTHFAWVVV